MTGSKYTATPEQFSNFKRTGTIDAKPILSRQITPDRQLPDVFGARTDSGDDHRSF